MEAMNEMLEDIKEKFWLKKNNARPALRLKRITKEPYPKTGKNVKILIDEYGKPISDAHENPDLAIVNRIELRTIHGILKHLSEKARIGFLTGVTRFTKTSLLVVNSSGDLTLGQNYSTISGYADAENDREFAAETKELGRA